LAGGGSRGHVGIVLDVTDRMRIEEELEDRRRFNALVADLSARLIDVDADKVDQAVRDALANLGESLDLDRVSLSERSDDRQQLNMIFGHFRGGPTLTGAMRMDTLHPWSWPRLNAGECVSFSKLDDLSADCATDKANWIGRSIKSLMLVPISIGGDRLFVFAAATTRHERTWSDELALRFRVLGETFAHAIVRARADNDLRESEATLRRLNTELLRAEETERRRLAAALHDELAQNLFAAIAQLVGLRGRNAQSAATLQLDAIISSLDQCLRQTRELTFDLCPPVLYNLGLIAALRKLGEQFQQSHGLAFWLDGAQSLRPMDAELASLLYQAVRELLRNVIKHARATRIDIRVEETTDRLSISVADDGVGLAVRSGPPDRSQSGFGLFNIKERLRALGGRVDIASAPGTGCTVRLVLPAEYRV